MPGGLVESGARELVGLAEAERRRIAAGIHDDSIQALTAAGLRLQILQRSLDDPTQLELLTELDDVLQVAISRLRHLVCELHPPALERDGLAAALQLYLEEAAAESSTRFRLDDRLESEPDDEAKAILYRIAIEALTNVRRHARATTAAVVLGEREGGYLIQVADDGVGFDADRAIASAGHLGLDSMRQRAELLGGSMEIVSAAEEGTTVEVWVPSSAESATPPSPGGNGG